MRNFVGIGQGQNTVLSNIRFVQLWPSLEPIS